MGNSSRDLHVVFVPFPSPGHIIPLVDMAKAMSSLAVTVTIVATTGNAPRIRPAIADHQHNIALLTIPFPSESSTVPENTTGLPTPELTSDFIHAMDELEGPFQKLMRELKPSPDCIVADSLFPWSSAVAARLGIPRIVFCSSGCFPCVAMAVLGHARPQDVAMLAQPQDRAAEESGDGDQPFLLPGLPHEIRMVRSQLPKELRQKAGEAGDYWMDFMARILNASASSFGTVTNSFYEMESAYVDMYRMFMAPKKVWNVGPVFLWNNAAATKEAYCLKWLESKKLNSVIYICFGSLGQFTGAQLRQMALGLESCEHPFVWVVRDVDSGGDRWLEWMPEGFEERVVESGKGLIVKGWAPQGDVLNSPAVGGFVTHCGWNSMLEGVAAGVPMVTWPLMYDQFFNERLIVDVLEIGVEVGSRSSSFCKEERTLVRGEQLRAAVDRVMGEGKEAEERRRRAEKLAAMAKGAVDGGGGSSCKDMRDMIQDVKNARQQHL